MKTLSDCELSHDTVYRYWVARYGIVLACIFNFLDSVFHFAKEEKEHLSPIIEDALIGIKNNLGCLIPLTDQRLVETVMDRISRLQPEVNRSELAKAFIRDLEVALTPPGTRLVIDGAWVRLEQGQLVFTSRLPITADE